MERKTRQPQTNLQNGYDWASAIYLHENSWLSSSLHSVRHFISDWDQSFSCLDIYYIYISALAAGLRPHPFSNNHLWSIIMPKSIMALTPAIQMRRLGSGSMKPRNVVEASSCAEAVSEPTSGDVTPAVDVAQASPATPLSLRDDSPERTSEDPQLSHKQIKGFAGLFLLCTIGFAVSSELVQSNEKRLSRSYSDIFDPGCIDKLGDSGSPGIAQAFNLDLTFGNFTFTQAKIIDVAWDTTIGQGGRLLHGWILYRCVMRRLLIYAMENYHVTCRYYLTVSWSRASFESLCGILKDFLFVQGLTNFYCTILLIYALGYTLLFSLLWSTATGYLSLSHRLYAMPDGNIVPLDTCDLALCWVLDGSRFDSPDDHVEIGPDFSTLDSLAEYFTYTDKTPCINESSSGDIKGTHLSPRRRLVYTSGGWKVNTATTIWDHFGLINGSNNVKNSSENFQSIRACGWRFVSARNAETLC